MKVLVTGGAGFIGSHVTAALLARGDAVVCLDNFNETYDPARKRRNVAPFLDHPNYRLIVGDIRDPAAVVQASTGVDACIHIAALAGVRASVRQAVAYAEGSVRLLEAAREANVHHIVYASSSSVYGRGVARPTGDGGRGTACRAPTVSPALTTSLPLRSAQEQGSVQGSDPERSEGEGAANLTESTVLSEDMPCDRPLAPYAATKRAGELLGYTYHNLYGLNFTALRLFSVYGPRGRPDMMPYQVTESIVQRKPIRLFNGGEMWRDWSYIDDIVSGILAALDTPLGYEIINLGRGEPVRMGDFVALLEALIGLPAIIQAEPAPPTEALITAADIRKARRLLHFNPTTPVNVGLQRFWDWYQREVLYRNT